MILLLIGFVMGASIDLLLDMPAINTIASITTLLIRPVIINAVYKKNQSKLIAENRIVKLHRNIVLVVSIILLHQLIYFLVDVSMFKNLIGFLKNFILTSLLTILVISTLLGFKLFADES